MEALETRVERQVGSMALSEVQGAGTIALMRAVSWYNVLVRLGFSVPLVVVHDVGCIVTGIAKPSASTRGMASARLANGWRELLNEFADTELARVPGPWKHRDAMVGIVLARVFSSVVGQLPQRARVLRLQELAVERVSQASTDPRSAFARYEQDIPQDWLSTMVAHRLLPVLELEQIDVDALRLLGIFRGDGQSLAGMELADLYQVIVSPSLSDVIDFSLELMPSLLEVRKEMGQQKFGMDGYASIERNGNLDSLVLSELAFDDETFERKFANRELFYYGHEKQVETERRTHLIYVDGSASMRGVREVFARGLALALSKRLAILGERCDVAFFDSRVHDGVRVHAKGGAEIPYVLQYRAERGRNYAEVLRQIEQRVNIESRKSIQPVVYLLTHGECQFPPELMATVAHRAPMYGIFVLPKEGFSLPYLDQLRRVHIIDAAATSHAKRAHRAREILSAVQGDLESSRVQMGGRA